MDKQIWGITVDSETLTLQQNKYVDSLPKNIPSVEWVWEEMDRVWNLCGLYNDKPFIEQDIGSFYGHPVWIMNGIFTEIDPVSIGHRKAIADYCKKREIVCLADYGGGSGVLAAQIATNHSIASIDVVEPYASIFFKKKLSDFTSIKFVTKYSHANYDCVIAQDVLEHVENPLEIAYQMSSHVKDNGYVIFANCFYPVIQCHLPSTFYLRHTFKFTMQKMGLIYLERIPGAEHVMVFQKKGEVNLEKAVRFIHMLKVVALVYNKIHPILSKVKSRFVWKSSL
jgi:2-polyprenyl-3-methyl-5-hydroxy-6-metoxy-1,4-benzoquinol methylase